MSAQLATTSLQDFIPLEKLGTGSFSSVYKVKRLSDNCIYALKKMKILALKQKEIQNALNEIRILASINCQHIVGYRQAFYDEKLNLLCLVMQLANQGDLLKKIQKQKKKGTFFSEEEIWIMIKNIILGLQSLHNHSILHRDIKSANIFLSNGIYKLGDMNVSKIQSDQARLAFTQTGTPNYASPQVWRDEPYDSKSDIWSLGCVIYEMCTFKPPFKGRNLDQLFKNVQRGYYDPISSLYSQKLKKIIALCLRLKAFDRPSCDQLVNIIFKQQIQSGSIKFNKSSKEKLIGDIKVPKNLKELNKSLPKPTYSQSKIKLSLNISMLQGYTNSKQNLINPQCQMLSPFNVQQVNINKVQKEYKKISSQKFSIQLNKIKLLKQQQSKNYKPKYDLCISQRNKQSSNMLRLKHVITERRIGIQSCKELNNNLQLRKNYQYNKQIFKNQKSVNQINQKLNNSKRKQLIIDNYNIAKIPSTNESDLFISKLLENPLVKYDSPTLKLKKVSSYPNISNIGLIPRLKNALGKSQSKKELSYMYQSNNKKYQYIKK